jgi:hypothetical protein
MKKFLEEWGRLAERAQCHDEEVLVEDVRRLAIRCQTSRDILKFIGD